MSPSDALLDLLDRIHCGAVLLDHKGRVAACNALAHELLGELERAQGERLGNSWARGLLEQLEQAERRGQTAPARLLKKRHGRPLIACKWSVPTSADGDPSPVLVLIDPDQHPGPGEGLLKSLFGLSGAEARLAAKLASGRSLEELAGELHVSLGTIRAHLRSVFAKTQTNRQSELVALLNRIALLRAGGQL